MCTTRSMAEAICSRMARIGRSRPAISTIVSMRDSASRGVLACSVPSEPSWPVFMAWSMSRASPPRHSPTMMRSGRMRSALRTRSRMLTSPRPSMLGGRDSRRTTWRRAILSSTASSMVTMRSPCGMKLDTTLSSVVLPVPVPPLIRMFSLPSTQVERNSMSDGRGRAGADVVLGPQHHLGELADGERRAVDSERRDDGVHAGAVGQAGVDHGRGLVHAAADGGHDAVDDAAQGGLVCEGDLGLLEQATALDPDAGGVVAHDLGDVGVLEQRGDGAVADDVGGDLLDQAGLLLGGERHRLLVHDLGEGVAGEFEQLVVGDLAVVRAGGQALHERTGDLVLQAGVGVGARVPVPPRPPPPRRRRPSSAGHRVASR